MKAQRDSYTMKSVVLVGTFALHELEDNSQILRSPFNAAGTIRYPFFKPEETKSLFEKFSACRREQLDPEIVREIHDLTKGHRGLTCLLGKLIDEDLRSNLKGKIPDLIEWAAFRPKIPEYVNEYPTMKKIIRLLSGDEEFAREARQILSIHFLPFSKATLTPTPNVMKVIKWLNAEGVLISNNPGTFELTSPLLRLIILSKVIRKDRRQTPSEPPPRFSHGNMLDIQNILFQAISFINPQNIIDAYSISCKKNRGNSYKRDAPVPEEAVYHFEIFTILCSWFPGGISISPEVVPYPNSKKAELSRQRCDILIQEGKRKYLIEFEASDPPDKIANQATRLLEHKKALNAKEAWLVYFSPANNFSWPKMNQDCFSLAVVHDDQFSKVSFYTSPEEKRELVFPKK
jgi:hypothetical protein